MKLLKLCVLALSCTLASSAFAIMCPGNFSVINMGDSLAQVQAACGKPTSQKSYDSTPEDPQEWNYYVSVNPAFYQNVSQNSQATLKTTVAFDDKGKVSNMSVNGVGVSNTAICGSTIQVGDSEDTVKAACGKPQFINRGTGSQANTANGTATASKTTELTYTTGTGTTTLVFENGVLTKQQ